MNNKGQAESDVWLSIAVIFGFLLIGIIGLYIYTNINGGLQSNSASLGADASASANTMQTSLARGFDDGAVIVITLMYIGLFITSRNIGTNPVWFGINIFAVVIALGIAAVLGNAFDTATNNATFVAQRAAMPGLTFIGNNLLYFGIGAAAMVLIGLFSKPGDEYGQ